VSDFAANAKPVQTSSSARMSFVGLGGAFSMTVWGIGVVLGAMRVMPVRSVMLALSGVDFFLR